ncbi:hypothetical protein [Streptomyces sp. NPDC097619]|uniref:hypothetical protein n=1 Tax=Streptomyces sp. NPDC097619 TaxID=3157228 RepID=UPI00331998C1
MPRIGPQFTEKVTGSAGAGATHELGQACLHETAYPVVHDAEHQGKNPAHDGLGPLG